MPGAPERPGLWAGDPSFRFESTTLLKVRVPHPSFGRSGGDSCCLGDDLVRHGHGSRTSRDPGHPAKLSILIPIRRAKETVSRVVSPLAAARFLFHRHPALTRRSNTIPPLRGCFGRNSD